VGVSSEQVGVSSEVGVSRVWLNGHYSYAGRGKFVKSLLCYSDRH
jgi:hypothetical protein